MSTIYLSQTANRILINDLQRAGHQIHLIAKTGRTYDPVSAHPDIYLCGLGPGGPVFFGDPAKVGAEYPKNILYNAACTGAFFIHNLNNTDPKLLAQAAGMEKIHVRQGYAKCSIVIVDETSIITADRGIYKACRQKLDVLLVDPGHVALKGFSYGFLGGASGRVGDEIIFNGNLEAHPDWEKIRSFIESHRLKVKYFPQYALEDIGSIIEEKHRP